MSHSRRAIELAIELQTVFAFQVPGLSNANPAKIIGNGFSDIWNLFESCGLGGSLCFHVGRIVGEAYIRNEPIFTSKYDASLLRRGEEPR